MYRNYFRLVKMKSGGNIVKEYDIKNNIPTLEEYKYLCDSVGWTNYMNFEVVETSLQNSIYCITVNDNNRIIGMGRIVGDGAIYFYIQDIVVHPDYQRNGIGKKIMNALVEYLNRNALIKHLLVCLHRKVKRHSTKNMILKITRPT